MKQKGKQKSYKNKNKTNTSIFNYDEEINGKKNKKKAKSKAPKGYDVNEEHFIGMDNNKKNKNKKVIKKLKKEKENQKKQKKKEAKKLEKIEEERRKREQIRNLSPKELKKRQARKYRVQYTSIVILLVFAIVLFLLSPIFHVKNIEIEGNSKVTSEEIKSLLQIGTETNIFKETTSNVNEKLKQNKYIEKADVRKILPSTLKITVEEREVEYLIEYANSYAYVDKNGNILEISTNEVEGKTKIIGCTTENLNEQEKLNDEDIKKLKDAKRIVQSAKQFEIADKVTSINIADGSDYQIYMKDESKIVHLGTIDNIDTKMLYVKAIVEKEKGNDGEIFVNMDLNKKDPYFRQNV